MIARACAVPRDAFLTRYVAQPGCYTDCFEVMSPGEVDLEAFIGAFYTTWLFRLERAVLCIPLRRIVRDADVIALADATSDHFAVWRVEDRASEQILLCDMAGHTASYLAISPKDGGVTRLLFGSVVMPSADGALTWWVRGLIPLHRGYSRILLRLAERKLRYG